MLLSLEFFMLVLTVPSLQVGAAIAETEMQELFHASDIDGTGQIDYEEFIAAMLDSNRVARRKEAVGAPSTSLTGRPAGQQLSPCMGQCGQCAQAACCPTDSWAACITQGAQGTGTHRPQFFWKQAVVAQCVLVCND
jgi:hypothetical protein